MTKVEIDGRTYCVETLIYEVERLTKDVKASAEYHRFVLDMIRAEVEDEIKFWSESSRYNTKSEIIAEAKANSYKHCLEIIDKHKAESEG